MLVASPKAAVRWKIHQDAHVLIGQVEPGQELSHDLAPGRQAWVHLIRGSATVNGQPLETGDAVAVTGEPSVSAHGTGELLVFDLAA